MIQEREIQKSNLLENFTIEYLEDMLKSTTKSIARDVVSTLIPTESSGTLLLIENKTQEKSREAVNQCNHSSNDEPNKSEDASNDSNSVKDAAYVNNENSQFDDSDPYKSEEISGVNQSSSSTVKLPPATQKPKISIKDKSTNSLRNSLKNRSSSSRPNSKGL